MFNWLDVYFKAAMQEVKECFWDIANGVRTLRRAYRRICPKNGPRMDVDYNLSENRAAYLYLYGPLHSDLVRQELESILKSNVELMNTLKSRPSIKICSLGGGPGTDVIGAKAALLRQCDFRKDVSAVVFDLHEGWSSTFSIMSWAAGYQSPRDYYYGGVNLVDDIGRPCQAQADFEKELTQADVVTVVKFFSVVAHLKEKAANFLLHLANKLKPGALVLFIDNSAGGFLEAIQDEMDKLSMHEVKVKRRHFRIPFDTLCDSNSREDLIGMVKLQPQYECSVCVAAYIKPRKAIQNEIVEPNNSVRIAASHVECNFQVPWKKSISPNTSNESISPNTSNKSISPNTSKKSISPNTSKKSISPNTSKKSILPKSWKRLISFKPPKKPNNRALLGRYQNGNCYRFANEVRSSYFSEDNCENENCYGFPNEVRSVYFSEDPNCGNVPMWLQNTGHNSRYFDHPYMPNHTLGRYQNGNCYGFPNEGLSSFFYQENCENIPTWLQNVPTYLQNDGPYSRYSQPCSRQSYTLRNRMKANHNRRDATSNYIHLR